MKEHVTMQITAHIWFINVFLFTCILCLRIIHAFNKWPFTAVLYSTVLYPQNYTEMSLQIKTAVQTYVNTNTLYRWYVTFALRELWSLKMHTYKIKQCSHSIDISMTMCFFVKTSVSITNGINSLSPGCTRTAHRLAGAQALFWSQETCWNFTTASAELECL